MKTRALALILCICIFACFSGCGKPDIVGDNLVMQAREDFEKLDSAQIVMTNTDTDKVEQTFTFKYDDGVLIYKDWKLVDGKENIEFNNGEVNVYYQNEKYYQYTKDDDKFIKYTRNKTHKKTQDAMLTYIPSAITDAQLKKGDGSKELTHVYDVTKVNPTVPKDAEATGFAVKFVFDSRDKLEYFTETTLYKTKDGTEHRLSYKTEIKDKNSVGEIENIIKEQA